MRSAKNVYQLEYIVSKNHVRDVENQIEKAEKKYMASKGIKNKDGTTPKRLYTIDNDAVFEKAVMEYTMMNYAAELDSELKIAKDKLEQAENDLIAYGLSLAPAVIRETLEKGAKENIKVREKLIDIVYQLDTSKAPSK